MDAKLTKVDKNELLSIENPQYEHVKAKYPHLAQVNLTDNEKKDKLPFHVILSVGDYARIKTNRPPVVGEVGEPVAEYTKLEWYIMSPGNEIDRQTMFLTQTSHVDYEELCRLDVLGFLQVRIKAAERDVLRFHWRRDDLSPLETLWFTRVLFGLVPSPNLLHGVIETHLDTWSKTYTEEVEHLRRSMYVDDLLSGGSTVEQATRRK
jgi:hypothetical protein